MRGRLPNLFQIGIGLGDIIPDDPEALETLFKCGIPHVGESSFLGGGEEDAQ